MTRSPRETLLLLFDRINEQAWGGVAELFTPDARIELAATGEVFDPASFAAFNASYPGNWRLEVRDVVDSVGRAVVRARVSDPDRADCYQVASFAIVRAGRIAELTEVWADETPPPSQRS